MNIRINRHSSFARSAAVIRGIAAVVLAGAACTATASADTIDASAFAGHFDIMFPGYAGAAPVENFPVLVRLSAERNGFDYASCQALGADLRFADAAGNLLPCEVDTWNPGGESLVWVKVPSLSRSTRITAYYGCANPPANTPSAVWSNGFVGVWHLGGSTLPLRESSGVSTPFSAIKGETTEVLDASGILGGAVDFSSATTNRLEAADDDDLDGFTDFTFEVWTKQDSAVNSLRYILQKNASSAYAYTFYQNKEPNHTTVFFIYSDPTNNKVRKNIAGTGSDMIPTLGEWNHRVVIRDTTKGKAFGFINGSPRPTTGNGVDLTSDDFNGQMCLNSSPLYLGDSSATFPGQIDELRISNVARSADWVKATHDCVADADFAAYGVGNDWTKYARKFTVSFPGAPDGTLTDFPVLVKVAENSPAGFSYADCRKPNGGDLRFADAAGNLLACEVDTWDTNGVSAVWVKIPSLTASTKITAYYGWTFAPPVDPADVWDDDYVGVWHLGESALPLKESSGRSYGFDTSRWSKETFAVSGAAGGAVDFSTGGATAISNRLSAANSAAQSGFNDFTVELWSKQEVNASRQSYLLAKWDSGQGAYLFNQNKSQQSVFRISVDGQNQSGNLLDSIGPETGAWHHQAIARETTSNGENQTCMAYGFMNGSNVSTKSLSDAKDTGLVASSTAGLYLGNMQGPNPSYAFPGQIDELRISKVARSADWVKATHDTVDAPSFAHYSATRGNNDATIISFR